MKWVVVASLALMATACGGGALTPSRDAAAPPASGASGGNTPAPSVFEASGGNTAPAATSDAQSPDAASLPMADSGGGGSGEPPPAEGLTVHEWGTFTSVNTSSGALMEGLHHEEEALPTFVHGRGSAAAGMKSLEAQPSGVTQKLETPVLYFYGGAVPRVRVRVDFPKGVLSEWYPDASTFGPAVAANPVAGMTVAGGFMEWQADLLPTLSPVDLPPVAPENIWAPSRRVASLPLAVGSEHERFIFYRGLGAFRLPLTIDVDANGLINLYNPSGDPSPAVFLLRVHAGGGAIVPLGPLPGGGRITGVPMPVGGKEHDLSVYVADAQTQIAHALEGTGLYPDEARAMVETWSRSYFQSFGLRILYVVPRAWTDSLLPLTIDPAPRELVRTLVGRVEVLAPSEESDLRARVAAAAGIGALPTGLIQELGRLAEPKLRRALELTTDLGARAWCQIAIATASAMP